MMEGESLSTRLPPPTSLLMSSAPWERAASRSRVPAVSPSWQHQSGSPEEGPGPSHCSLPLLLQPPLPALPPLLSSLPREPPPTVASS